MPVRLADNYALMEVTRAKLTDIKVGDYVGAAAVRQADGTFRAQEVLIFPFFARGSREGHFPWDLTRDSTMTNAATVAGITTQGSGRTLTLKHKGGEVVVVVPATAPVVTFGIGHVDQLQPGARTSSSRRPGFPTGPSPPPTSSWAARGSSPRCEPGPPAQRRAAPISSRTFAVKAPASKGFARKSASSPSMASRALPSSTNPDT